MPTQLASIEMRRGVPASPPRLRQRKDDKDGSNIDTAPFAKREILWVCRDLTRLRPANAPGLLDV